MKYIDADNLKADIKSIIESDHPIEYELMEKRAYDNALWDAINLIDTLQQERQEPFSCGHENGSEPKPEVDLEKEFQEYWYLHHYDQRLRRQIVDGHGKEVLKNVARHFYELGLKARKED